MRAHTREAKSHDAHAQAAYSSSAPAPAPAESRDLRMPDDLNRALGEAIRAARLEHGFTQKELGDGSGIAPQQFSKFENVANRSDVERAGAGDFHHRLRSDAIRRRPAGQTSQPAERSRRAGQAIRLQPFERSSANPSRLGEGSADPSST